MNELQALHAIKEALAVVDDHEQAIQQVLKIINEAIQSPPTGITGKDVYEAARPYLQKEGFEVMKWEEVTTLPGIKECYECMAQLLNNAHLAPLQGLVRGYQEFNKQDPFQTRANYHVWNAKRSALQTRAQSLLAVKEH
jgi:hypothetical protein